MKQTNIRASGKARTNRRNPQSPNGRLSSQEITESTPATPAPAAVKTSAPAAGDVSLILFHHSSDQTFAELVWPSARYQFLKGISERSGLTLLQLIERSLEEKIQADKSATWRPPAVKSPAYFKAQIATMGHIIREMAKHFGMSLGDFLEATAGAKIAPIRAGKGGV